MRGYNKVMLLGRLTADPECRQTTTGKSVAHFSIAVDRNMPKGSEPVVDFHRVVAWQSLADFVGKYLKKGMGVFIIGALYKHSYEGKLGKQIITEIVLREINVLTWKGKESKIKEPAETVVEEVEMSTEELSATISA
jgi:single-strand DNA-binding protein